MLNNVPIFYVNKKKCRGTRLKRLNIFMCMSRLEDRGKNIFLMSRVKYLNRGVESFIAANYFLSRAVYSTTEVEEELCCSK